MNITAAAFIGARATRQDRSQIPELTAFVPITVLDTLKFDYGGDSEKECRQCGVRVDVPASDNRAAVPVDLV